MDLQSIWLRRTPRVLSLGAGVQSTALLLLAAEGRIPAYDVAIFADTGWEPRSVYQHLDRLEREVARPAGIPILRVSVGNIRTDALDPNHRFALMPLYVANDDGTRGMARRQCTAEYKIRPILQTVRRMLGARDKPNGRPGRVPGRRMVVQSIGISRDEIFRAKDSQVRYVRHVFPLLDLPGSADGRVGWTRSDCTRYLRTKGFGSTPKSSCIGCPFRRNASWRAMRDTDPQSWADAVQFDQAIRCGSARANASGSPLRGRFYMHSSCRPLDQAPIDRVTRSEWASRQTDLFEAIADTEAGLTDSDSADEVWGCSPFTCPGDLTSGVA
jgi:3'-phosphoadenosine 5'-phosphosulfate sulfotransferase (PAPS reductase)/FAD synthetase